MSLSRGKARWPKLPDGTCITGPRLFQHIQDDIHAPPIWDLRSVVEEVEENFGADVEDIPAYECGQANQVSLLYLSVQIKC